MERELYELEGPELLVHLRKRAGFETISAASRAFGGRVSRSYLSELESGASPLDGLTIKAVGAIAEVYEVDAGWLVQKILGGSRAESPKLAHQQQGLLYAPGSLA